MGKSPIKFALKIKTSRAAEKAITSRVQKARGVIAEGVADKVAEVVQSKLRGGGWIAIYKEAIKYFVTKDRELWAIAGLWPKELSEFPANTTLITFEGDTDDVTRAMVARNPWTIDQIPAIAGGYRGDVKARPASTGDVEANRERLVAAHAEIVGALTAAQAQVIPGEFPTIRGKTYADIAFMALALEHGQAGLPRTPHWVAAFRAAKSQAAAWAEQLRPRAQAVIDGDEKFDPEAREMPGDLEDVLREAGS